ncbi:hypothetical protein [Planctomicrobium piriforme]|uniref:Uncharacterized protein n=1 Tax=Planctomicrobium piriforme TaxID=1576369 RepID=A0A1I3S2E8_9PLAN|nr:hypothetical protein [Planctomicrobium piriforme]SFJ51706.1 hypothetical protein SAMN05421753_12254 [Planctomicrobium piriforme]
MGIVSDIKAELLLFHSSTKKGGPMPRSTLFPYVLFFSICFATGCGPISEPVWNYDSRSFFHTRSDGSVAQYDLDKKASRVLLAAGEQRPRSVALGPTVPAVAFAQAAMGAEAGAVQVGLYSLLNSETSWSKLQIWGDAKARRDLCSASCYYCPTGKRILIWYHTDNPLNMKNETDWLGRFAVYEVENNKLMELTAPPAMLLAQGAHVSPMCPDGSGYLAMKLNKDNEPQFLFVDWDGWEYPLETDLENASRTFAQGNRDAEGVAKAEHCFPLPQGIWSGQVLRCPIPQGVIAFDLKARRIKNEPLTESQKKEFDQIFAYDAADRPWTTIQTSSFEQGRYALHCRLKMDDDARPARIELVDGQLQRRRVLLEGTVPEFFLVHHLFPSPDRRLILACLLVDHRAWIHVIQSDGQIVAKVDCGPFQMGAK